MTEDPITPPAARIPGPGFQPHWRRRFVLAALGTVLGIAAVLVWLGRDRPAGRAERVAPQADPSQALASALDRALRRDEASAAPGIALRPLAPADADPETVALGEATCGALANQLARLRTLRVIPCRSTDAAVAAQLDDRGLARLLSVRYVLRGELLPLPDDRLRVRLQLREPAADRVAWQTEEEIALGDLQTLPQRVSRSASAALGLAPQAAPAAATIDPALYARFVRARSLGSRPSIDAKREAVRLLDEVLGAEPDHLPSLALRHSLQGFLLGNEAPSERKSASQLDAERAAHAAKDLVIARRLLDADPADPGGQILLLSDEIENKRWAAAFERLDTMVRQTPQHPGLMRLAARLHLHAGYLERAQSLALAAAQINALDAQAFEILAMVAGMQRRDGAMRELTTIARQLGHEGLGRLEVIDAYRRQDMAKLEESEAAWVSWGGTWSADWVPAWTRGVTDETQREAVAQRLDAHDAGRRQHFVSYFIEYALLGDPGRSLKAVQHHSRRPPATWMQGLWWPELAAVRADPGFAAAMDDLGFVDLWRARGAPDLCTRGPDDGWQCR